MNTPFISVTPEPMGSRLSNSSTALPAPGFGVTVTVNVTAVPSHDGFLLEVIVAVWPCTAADSNKNITKEKELIFLATENMELFFFIRIPGKSRSCMKDLFTQVINRRTLRER